MQLDIFSTPAPYVRHSVTSLEAAESIGPHLSRLQDELLGFIQRRGALGATDEEMQKIMPANTQRPRRIELAKKGLIVAADFERKTKSGRNATVWLSSCGFL
jgi:hypothetical protein